MRGAVTTVGLFEGKRKQKSGCVKRRLSRGKPQTLRTKLWSKPTDHSTAAGVRSGRLNADHDLNAVVLAAPAFRGGRGAINSW